MKTIDFNNASFIRSLVVFQRPDSFASEVKDFENIPGMDHYGWAKQ